MKPLDAIAVYLGVALVLAVALYYYFGTATVLGTLASGIGNVVGSYGNLLKPQYPGGATTPGKAAA